MHERNSSNTSLSSIVSIQQQVQDFLQETTPFLSSQQVHQETSEDYQKLLQVAIQQQALLKKLKLELELEQNKTKILKNEQVQLKKASVELHAEHEKEEEMIMNRLLKRINGLKKEKNEIMTQMEIEEEAITNKLQKRLSQLEKEKLDLEIQLETESEYMINKLGKRMSNSMSQLHYPHSAGGSIGSNMSQQGQDLLEQKELEALKAKLLQVEREHVSKISTYQTQIQMLKEEIQQLSNNKK